MKKVVVLSFNQYIGSTLSNKLQTSDNDVIYLYLAPNNAYFDLPEDLYSVVVVPRCDSFSSWLEIEEYEKRFINNLISDVNRTNENAKVIYLSNSLNSHHADKFYNDSLFRIEERIKESNKNSFIIRVGEIFGEKQIPTSYNSFASICLSIINETPIDDELLSKNTTFTYIGDVLSFAESVINNDENTMKTINIGTNFDCRKIIDLLSSFKEYLDNEKKPIFIDSIEENMFKVFSWYNY